MTRSKVLVALVFLAGCVVGGASSQLVIPPARAGTTPTRWQYICTDDVEALREAGQKGWELVTATVAGEYGTIREYCLKRPLQ
jgi:hypothetical protein